MAWVSVERGERDGQRFWLSVIDALAQVVGSVERVSPAPGFPGELAVERLLSELSLLEDPVVLVIDDLHEVRSAEAPPVSSCSWPGCHRGWWSCW